MKTQMKLLTLVVRATVGLLTAGAVLVAAVSLLSLRIALQWDRAADRKYPCRRARS